MSKVHLRKYGVAATIDFVLYETDGIDFKVDAVHASGDTKIMKDEGAEANTTNGFADEGQGYSHVLTATEMEAARIVIYVVDQSTKVWLDKKIVIETYGHASAQHAFDLDTAIPGVDVVQVSGDVTAADNLELQYDTTGLTGDTFPATQAAVGNLTSGSAAINTTAKSAPDGFVITTGVSEVNDEDATHPLDGITHDLEDDAGTTDAYYIFDVGGNGVPISITWDGYVNSNGDTWGVYAYNWGTASWEQVGSISGANGSTIITETFILTNAHVGTGANAGLVHFRLYSVDGTKMATDRITCAYAVVAQSVGYANGAIWVDTNASNTNTEVYVDGVADNPVSTWAAALILSAALGIERFQIANGSLVTLSGNSDNYDMLGNGWTLELNGQSISGAHIEAANTTGIGVGATEPHLHDCELGDVTLDTAHALRCGFSGTVTLATATTYTFESCYSQIAGTAAPVVDFGAAIGNTDVNVRRYSGGIEVKNMGQVGTDTMSIEGHGQLIINANCAGGTITVRGHFILTDNSGGAVTVIVDDITAVVTGTLSQLSVGAPTATPTLAEVVALLYGMATNKITVTGGFKSFYDSAGTITWKKALADDGTTYTEANSESG